MVTDLPDYEKKVIVVTIPGEYPGLIDINHKQVGGVTLKTPTVSACLPISIEHTVLIDHRAILGEALKTPTFANCVPTSIENDAIAYDATNDRFYVDLAKISATDILAVSATDLDIRALVSTTDSVEVKQATASNLKATVEASNLDIRDLTSVSDSVEVKQATAANLKATVTQESIARTVTGTVTAEQATASNLKGTVYQSDETSLKATVTQAEKDRTITGTVTAEQATKANLNANVFTKHDNKTYKVAVFDASASGNLVAAVAGKVIKLHALTIQAQNTVVVNLNNGSGGSSLMEWSFQAREGAVIPMANAPAYWAITGVNTALYVTLSDAVVVTITAIYSDDDAS